MKSIKRRTFLNRSVAATAAFGLGSYSSVKKATAGQDANKTRRPNPIAVSTYSFWQFRRNQMMSIEKCIEEASRMGFDGVDILLRQMEREKREENEHCRILKRTALINGVDLCCMSTHQGFLSPDKNKRRANIDLTKRQIEIAYKLGIPIIRINTGTWGTS
ncbi:MAG TPA: xylose isomerase, partial [Phycisphaerales bacterium]|nr:xylose isomerase [Phycisphaerales bacterium]